MSFSAGGLASNYLILFKIAPPPLEKTYQIISNSHHTNDNRTRDHQFFLAHPAYLVSVYRMNESLGVALAPVYAQPLIAAAKIWGC